MNPTEISLWVCVGVLILVFYMYSKLEKKYYWYKHEYERLNAKNNFEKCDQKSCPDYIKDFGCKHKEQSYCSIWD